MHESTIIRMRRTHMLASLLAALAVLGALVGARPAEAAFGLQPGSLQAAVIDGSGAAVAEPQAGAHPFAQQLSFAFNTAPTNQSIPYVGPDPSPDGQVKTIVTELPAGLIGNPQAVPRCEQSDFPPLGQLGFSRCKTASQVGVVSVQFGINPGYPLVQEVPLFNLTPPKGVVARFGFVPAVPVVIDITVRSGSDYGITATMKSVSQGVNIYASTVTLWGVPADASHDADRYLPGAFAPGDGNGNPLPSGLPLVPFLTNPARCGTDLTTTLRVASWQDPDNLLSYTSAPQQFYGCDRLTLDSSLNVTPTSAGAGEPTGVAIDLDVNQPSAPNALGSPPLKKVTVTLPEGMSVSPSSADGLGACTADQIGLGSDAEPTCPDSSKIGSVQIDTPLLADPLEGSVYLAKPGAGNNPFGSLVALYIVAKGNGVIVKLPGEVSLDKTTGRVTSTFDNTPQLPFSRLHVAFKGGARAPLSQADTCGTKTTSATLTTWSGQTETDAGTYTVGTGAGSPTCGAAGFSPQMTAGSTSPVAGASSPFTFRLTRTDADQDLSSLQTTLPAGLLASVKDVPLCQEADAAAGTCGAASQIGGVTVGSGPGTAPFYINTGRAYLTTGYRGAPFGLSMVVPAVAGPFDLGTVVVRAALSIDPVTTRVTVATNPFPTILQGIPLQLRDVRLTVDRPGFMLNPTSCARQSVDATVVSTSGTKAAVSDPFQATDCGSLPLNPKLALALTGKGQTHDDQHPGLVAHLTQSADESRLRQAAVTLPLSMALDPDNAEALCKPEQAAAKACPANSIVGQASAVSVLHQPLTGPVYFVEGRRTSATGRTIRTLPKLFIPLKGEGVEVDLNASSEVDPLNRLVTTFTNIPDAPISSFDLTIRGGKHGILVVSGTSLCSATQVAEARMDGQNGKIADSNVVVSTPCTPSILSSRVTKRAVTVKLGGLGAGKVTVSGRGLRRVSRTLAKSSVVTVVAKRTRSGKAPTKITVRFDPAGPAKAKSYTLSLKRPVAKKSQVKR